MSDITTERYFIEGHLSLQEYLGLSNLERYCRAKIRLLPIDGDKEYENRRSFYLILGSFRTDVLMNPHFIFSDIQQLYLGDDFAIEAVVTDEELARWSKEGLTGFEIIDFKNEYISVKNDFEKEFVLLYACANKSEGLLCEKCEESIGAGNEAVLKNSKYHKPGVCSACFSYSLKVGSYKVNNLLDRMFTVENDLVIQPSKRIIDIAYEFLFERSIALELKEHYVLNKLFACEKCGFENSHKLMSLGTLESEKISAVGCPECFSSNYYIK